MSAFNIIPFLLLFSISAISQEANNESGNGENTYKVKIRHMNGKTTIGYAYTLSEDKISVYNPYANPSNSNKIPAGNSGSIIQYPVSDIKKITFREKHKFRNNVLGGLLVGAISGLLVGAIKKEGIEIPIGDAIVIDLTHPPVPVNFTKMVLYGASAGAVLGAISGSVSKSFIIKGKKEVFRENQGKMNKYMLAYQQAPAF